MYLPVHEVPLDVHEEGQDVLGGPAEDAGEEGERHALDALEQVLAAHCAEELVLVAAGPRVEGAGGVPLDDALEAGLAHVAAPLEVPPEVLACAEHPFVHEAVPLAQGGAVHGPVVAPHGHAGVLQLKVTPRREVVVDVPDDGGAVAEARHHGPGVDVVKGLVEAPVGLLGVADLEAAVARDHGGLDWRQVGADDGGPGVLFRHLDGPDAGPRAEVEDAAGVDERGDVQPAVEEDLECVVLQVEALLLDLVVGQEVFCGLRSAGRSCTY